MNRPVWAFRTPEGAKSNWANPDQSHIAGILSAIASFGTSRSDPVRANRFPGSIAPRKNLTRVRFAD
jgi:hypothetical protein